MTLPLNSRLSALYDTNGTQKDFSFGFRVFFDPDNGGYGLEVRRQTADGYEVIPKSDYLVLPVEDNSAGVVRFSVAPSAGQQIYIAGKTPTIQQLVLTNFGRYSAESIETQFDFITAIIQEWLSALGEETRQRMAADEILTQYVVNRINDFVQQINQNWDDKSQEIEDYIATIMPSFTQTLRDEIEAYAVAGMQDAIDTTLAGAKSEIDDAVARATAAATAAAISGKVYDTPEAGVDPVTGVQNGAYYNVRSPYDDSFIIEYQNIGGVPTPSGKSYPSSEVVQKIANYTALPFVDGKTYRLNERIVLANGDIVKSTVANNIVNPNIDMTGWISIGNHGEVESIADLLTIKNPKHGQVMTVLSRNAGTGKGGGVFVFHEGSVKNDGGRFFATASGSWHRLTLDTWLNLQWWGVVSDGVTDDQPAIMSAIEAFGDLAFNNMSNPSESAFCTFRLPASDKSTVIKDTVWLLPYMRIIGDSANGGSLATLYDNNASIIETKFPLAENYKWAISTRNYVRATGELTPWNSNYSGSNYDNGLVTACFGSQVKDVVVVNKDTTKRVYGGIRMQNAPQCGVDAYVRGFDVGVYVGGSWRSYVKADTECYKAGVVVFGDSNNPQISAYTHGNQDSTIEPMTQQHQVFNGIDGTSGLENFATWKDKTYGTFLLYCYGFSAALISEYNDVGNLYGNSTGNVSSAYCELNKIGDAFFASAVTIGAVAGVNNVKAFAFGTGSRVELPVVSPNHYSAAIRDESNSQYNSEIICPVTTNLSGANVYYKNNTQRVFLNATTGSDLNNGMTSNTPVKTIDKAIDIISKQVGSDSTVKSSSGAWSIVIMDSSTYTPLAWSTIKNDVAFESLSSTPEIHFGEAIFFAVDCKVSFRGVNVTRGNNNNYQTSTGGIIAKGGDVEVSIINGNTTCLGAPSLVSIDPAVTCNLSLSISGGTCAINSYSRFVELSKTAVVASTIRASISQNITGTVGARSDFGIEAPASNILKAIVVNTATSAKHVLP